MSNTTTPISTTPSPSFIGQRALMIIICLGLGIWGAYDLWVTIPRRETRSQQFETLSSELKQIETQRQSKASRGEQPTAAEIAEYQRVTAELTALAPGGKIPAPPSKFDHVVQWIYISCIPFGIWPLFTLRRVFAQRYRLDESGSLHFEGDKELGSATWSREDIADIDMSRWMAKSLAWVEHRDGARLELDAFHHKNLDAIVGVMAHDRYPDQWQEDARPVKAAGEDEVEPEPLDDDSLVREEPGEPASSTVSR